MDTSVAAELAMGLGLRRALTKCLPVSDGAATELHTVPLPVYTMVEDECNFSND
jgi:hypothetical protein